jgi:formylglycine-generating enzyme required for sulfatase activity
MADIFVSYKREDRPFVAKLVALFEARQWSVWWDSRLGAGEQWDAEIERQLHAARCVIVIWSPTSVESYWVRSEAHYGRERGILVPILIDSAHPPITFALIHATDLSGWSGSSDDERIAAVLERVEQTLKGERPLNYEDTDRQLKSKGGLKWWIRRRPWWQWMAAAVVLVSAAGLAVPLLTRTVLQQSLIPAGVLAVRNASPVHDEMDWVPAGWTEIAPKVKVYTGGFLIDHFEVTVADFEAFVQATNYDYESENKVACNFGNKGRERQPMNCVTWLDARAFADWAQKSLPREAEWLRAALGRPPVPAPPAALGRNGTDVVGRYPSDASGFGPHDMLGNVSEWAADWYAMDRLRDGVRDPQGPPSGQERLLLGSWYGQPPAAASVTLRRRDLPDAGRYRPDYGFRLVIRETAK